ncbi:MAG: hypothetical protein O2967_14525 [Proteobacteria bacterium]|nr:hypothetical protein [Pseudomonadota bacterium]
MRPATLLAILLAHFLCLTTYPAAAAGLGLELNKAEDSAQGCLATVLIGNDLGQTLDRFRLDLVLFDSSGVLFDRLLIDLAPLPAGRTTIARFALHAGRCDGISRILLRDLPACRAQDGKTYDCLTDLVITTRAAIGFSK